LDMGPDPSVGRVSFGGKGRALQSIGTFCRELCKNDCTDPFAVWVVDFVGGMKHEFIRICQVATMCTSSIVLAR